MSAPADIGAADFGSWPSLSAPDPVTRPSVGTLSALHRVLPEFEVPAPGRSTPPAWRLLEPPPPSAPADPEEDPFAEAAEPEPEPEPERDPVGEAVTEALAEAAARHEATLAQAEAHAAAELAAARAHWAAAEGGALAEHFGKAVAVAGDAIADAVAALLEPFLAEAIRRSAVEDLRQAIAELVAAGAGGRIAVSGPQDLLDALSVALDRGGTPPGQLDLTPSDTAEVAITADSSTVRTRLADWMEALKRRIEGEA